VALGDIVFVDVPQVGDDFAMGDSFDSVESLRKATLDVYTSVSGMIVNINKVRILDEPDLVNK
jgi:glycine cleavage system H protein